MVTCYYRGLLIIINEYILLSVTIAGNRGKVTNQSRHKCTFTQNAGFLP
jgi:hypothetical protein